MQLKTFCIVSIAAIATALPHRGGPSQIGNGPLNGQQGRPSAQVPSSAAPAGMQAPASTAPAGVQPPASGNGTSSVASLVPQFGIEAGQQPDGTGNCVGNGGKLIPCQCPPDRALFIQKVQAAAAAGNSEGVPVSFPTDDSAKSQKARIATSIIVLQNLNSKGVGCPAASTTFLDQQKALS